MRKMPCSQTQSANSESVFCAVQRIVDEAAAMDRSLATFGEGLAADDALAEIADLLNAQPRVRRTSNSKP